MRIRAKPQHDQETSVDVTLSRCTISKVVNTKGKVQVTLETELSDTAMLEDVKTLVGLSAGLLVDVLFRESPEAVAEDEG